jgi:hypothetical protein
MRSPRLVNTYCNARSRAAAEKHDRTWMRSSSQRLTARRGDPHARDLDRFASRDDALGGHGREPGENYLGEHVNGEAVCPHDRLRAAVRGRGEQFERAAAGGLRSGIRRTSHGLEPNARVGSLGRQCEQTGAGTAGCLSIEPSPARPDWRKSPLPVTDRLCHIDMVVLINRDCSAITDCR